MLEQNNFEHKEIIKCRATLNRKMFYDNSSGFGIMSMDLVENVEGNVELNSWGNFIVKGTRGTIDNNTIYTIVAKEIIDEKWGKQYECIFIGSLMDLTDTNKQRIFLRNILTENQVEEVYNTLQDPFNIIKNEDIESLTKVKGIGVKTALKIIEKYKQSIDYSEVYVELNNYGLTPKMIEKLVDKYKSPNLVVQKVKENPYILIEDVEGIGWGKADDIALKGGMELHSPYRVKAFIKHHLEQEAQDGNTYVIPNSLMRAILEKIGNIDRKLLGKIIQDLHETKILWWNDNKTMIALRKYVLLEWQVAKNIIRLRDSENNFVYDDWEEIVKQTEKQQGWEFTEEQKQGIKDVLENQVTIVTGGAGVGKSSVVNGMLNVLHNYSYAQTALSGKASARLAEVTGEEGYTIHRLLKFNPLEGGFLHDKDYPLPYEVIILDELSMVGGGLYYRLIQAIANGSKIVMLGDTGQLEAIGVMNILKDLIDSKVVKVVELTKIHRQAQKSAIITDSLKVRNGEQITKRNFKGVDTRGELQDLILDIYEDKDYSQNKIIHYFKKYFPTVKDIMDLQVIVPMKNRGECCTFEINKKLQEIYNPSSISKKEVEIKLSKTHMFTLREDDKILNTKNNYKTVDVQGKLCPIYNGTTGIILEIDEWDDIIIADFQGIGEVIIPKSHWKYLDLGYAMTTHKCQGSQADICIIGGIDFSAYSLLNRELIYTAITRAKKIGILCADNKALHHAIRTSKVKNKQTLLKEFLQNYDFIVDKIKI